MAAIPPAAAERGAHSTTVRHCSIASTTDGMPNPSITCFIPFVFYRIRLFFSFSRLDLVPGSCLYRQPAEKENSCLLLQAHSYYWILCSTGYNDPVLFHSSGPRLRGLSCSFLA
ncbi:MAG: hypothetical protein PHT17_08570 [Proteiniphilum sp.]|nr:hypothetical protein [Proteiniphilum sp.]